MFDSQKAGNSADGQPLERLLDVRQATIAGALVLTVHGDVDALTAPGLTEAIFDVPVEQSVIVDLSHVEFLASAGMSVLVTGHQRHSGGAQFAVVADGPATSRPLRLMGLDTVLALYPTLDEALSACAG
jgi:anti-sigma B factor antagonist